MVIALTILSTIVITSGLSESVIVENDSCEERFATKNVRQQHQNQHCLHDVDHMDHYNIIMELKISVSWIYKCLLCVVVCVIQITSASRTAIIDAVINFYVFICAGVVVHQFDISSVYYEFVPSTTSLHCLLKSMSYPRQQKNMKRLMTRNDHATT